MSLFDKLPVQQKRQRREEDRPRPDPAASFNSGPVAKDFLAKERRAKVAAARNAFLLIAFSLLLVGLTISGVFLAANRNNAMAVLQASEGDPDWIRVRRPEKDQDALTYYALKAVEEYVVLRESLEPDVREMGQRWGPEGDLRMFSSSAVYEDFTKELETRGGSYAILQAVERQQQQRARVASVKPLGPWQFEADYTVHTFTLDGREVGSVRRRAVVVIDFANAVVLSGRRHINPFGMRVTNFRSSRISE